MKAVSVEFLTDKFRRRGLFNIGLGLIACIGFTILLIARDSALQYAAMFLCIIGVSSCVPSTITWVINNIQGRYKRGLIIAALFGWADFHAITALYVLAKVQGVHAIFDIKVIKVILVYFGIGLVCGSIANYILLSIANRRRETGREYRELLGDQDELGDIHQGFRYML